MINFQEYLAINHVASGPVVVDNNYGVPCHKCGIRINRSAIWRHLRAGKPGGCAYVSPEEARGYVAGVACQPADEPAGDRSAVLQWRKGYKRGKEDRMQMLRLGKREALVSVYARCKAALGC
jgi:hypothetical protein